MNVLSRWLAGHVSEDDVRAAVDDVEGLTADQQDAVGDLRAALEGGRPPELQRAAREALEALALG